ncbi:MlaD family protein [Pinisolibacter aquiterrae]|uniref:MlaD family protein n=1 Tax=Pinisolibacter aquiterrae TaxID=2815579 RepID=UPI001C3E23A5|nr:MlaD family protein [Pinisolibacter aquiterrae]MBV5265146.1 MCE family protein [Pinisolibacter aquiterrae]MCC8235524.1 MlaD family protein [Pinisolibacter aquiterrae]
METRANLVTVGLFVLALIAAGFGSAFWLLKGSDSSGRSAITVVFPGSVSGLVTGASVTFNGIKVGEVARLSFSPDDPERVVARIAVESTTPIKTDSHVSLGYQGLTGVSFVQVWGGSAAAQRLLEIPENDRVMLAERSTVQDIMEGAQRVLARVDSAVGTIDQLVKDNAKSVETTARNVEAFSNVLAENKDGVRNFMESVGKAADVLAKISAKAETLVGHVDDLVVSVDKTRVASIVDHADATMARLDEASKRVDGILAKLDGLAGSDEGKGLAVKAGDFLDEAKAAAKSIRETAVTFQAKAEAISAGLERFTGSGLRDLRDFVADGRRTLSTIDRTVGNLDRDPKRLIFGGQGGNVPEYSGNRR